MKKNTTRIKFVACAIGMACSLLYAKGPHFITEKDTFTYNKSKIVLCALGSHNPSGRWNKTGYQQSLPPYLQQLITTNKELLSTLTMILIDPNWTKENYEKSDLKRHLNTLEKSMRDAIEDNLYLVPQEYDYKDNEKSQSSKPNWLVPYLMETAKSGGIVFLADAYRWLRDSDLGKLYNTLRLATANNKVGNIQLTSVFSDNPLWFGTFAFDKILNCIDIVRRKFTSERVIRGDKDFQNSGNKENKIKKFRKYIAYQTKLANLLFQCQQGHVDLPWIPFIAMTQKATVIDCVSKNSVLVTEDFIIHKPLPCITVSFGDSKSTRPLLTYQIIQEKDDSLTLMSEVNVLKNQEDYLDPTPILDEFNSQPFNKKDKDPLLDENSEKK